MKLTSIVTAALLLAAPVLDAAAKDISSPVETIALQTGDNSLSFGNNFAGATAGDTFADRFYFSLANTADILSTATSNSVRATQGIDLTGYALFNADTNALVVGGTRDYLNKQIKFNYQDKFSLVADDLAAGNYYLQVSGNLLSTGGSFAGNGTITVTALPVPEPTMPALMLGGLAVLAVAARRKAKQ
jgi:hypothetical protein